MADCCLLLLGVGKFWWYRNTDCSLLLGFGLWMQFGNAVSEMRAQVEMMVLSADGNEGMRTCVLRPSNLFGPGDSSLMRFVAGYARSPLSKVFEAAISLFLFNFLRAYRDLRV